MYQLDSTQKSFDFYNNKVSQDVWGLKYKRRNEATLNDTLIRVASAVFHDDEAMASRAHSLMADGIFLPGGRVLAGAGLEEHDSTLSNCFVMGTIDDSLEGIMSSLRESAITTKFGGGIGLDFGTLRPKGAKIKTASYFAGGPVAFMKLWDAMGHALEAGGNRRGGKMAVMPVSHPDVLEFIEAKSKGGVLTSFNISVGVTDDFMKAVATDSMWAFKSEHPRHDHDDETVNGKEYVWSQMPAREVWDRIISNTYKYSEPGVLFIDRANSLNNLAYREYMAATNPCGEQWLPPYGSCNLGHINLARLVNKPFTKIATIDYITLQHAVNVAVTFLDRMLDKSKYPLDEQYIESQKVRRIGLGITGLADMLAQLGVPYNSPEAHSVVSGLMEAIANQAYIQSAELAKQHGPFPDYNFVVFIDAPFVQRLSASVRQAIIEYGIRNGVLLSIAPTGTVSTVFGDVSSGCEPHFSHRTVRKIKVKDENHNDTWAEYTSYSYAVRMYAHAMGVTEEAAYAIIANNPESFPTAQTITVDDHLQMVGVLQHWVDSAISKTINCPEDITLEEFKQVYMDAYKLGCKGCATYRPSIERGAVLISGDAKQVEKISAVELSPGMYEATIESAVLASASDSAATTTPHGSSTKGRTRAYGSDYKRGFVMEGKTYKLRWPDLPSPIFVTINHDEDGHPLEIFISSKNAMHNEWTVALSVLTSKLLQYGAPLSDVAEQLKQIVLSTSTAYDNGRHYSSLVSRIGHLLEDHERSTKPKEKLVVQLQLDTTHLQQQLQALTGDVCKFCTSRNVVRVEGCLKCNDCGNSKCD